MSDDTPTQRFDAPLTPTGPTDTAGPASPSGPPDDGGRRSRGLLIALIVVGAILVVAIIVLVITLLGGRTPTAATSPTASDSVGSASPTVSDTPTVAALPSQTATAAPPATTTTKPPAAPPATGLAIASFTSPTTVKCAASDNSIYLDFSWSGSGGVAYFAVGSTNDPKDQGFNTPMPPTGTQNDFPDGNMILYPCGQATAVYTLGMYDASGHSVIRHLTVKNTGVVGP